MIWAVYMASEIWGLANVIKYYGIPWFCVSHWFIMITYVCRLFLISEESLSEACWQLHHTSMEIPHYRAAKWNYQRGAAATIDRDFLGWQGRFFLHDGS
jgi:hypothetical protein